MNLTDGELVQFGSTDFEGLNLLKPSAHAQAVLQIFASIGCVYSAFRLSYSLYPDNPEHWPIKSEELAFYYSMMAMEGRISLKFDPRMAPKLIAFEFSQEFRRYKPLLLRLVDKYEPTRLICEEIVSHVRRLDRLH